MIDYFRTWRRRSSALLVGVFVGLIAFVGLGVGWFIPWVSERNEPQWLADILNTSFGQKLAISASFGLVGFIFEKWWKGFCLWLPVPTPAFVFIDNHRSVLRREELQSQFQTIVT